MTPVVPTRRAVQRGAVAVDVIDADPRGPVTCCVSGVKRDVHLALLVEHRSSVSPILALVRNATLHHAEILSLKGDSYRLRGKDLDARPSARTADIA
jgi:hypothetical protein